MHVNSRKMAVSGLLMAFDVVLIILSGVLDFNTLFFLAAAAAIRILLPVKIIFSFRLFITISMQGSISRL